jgi:hypothetical protein
MYINITPENNRDEVFKIISINFKEMKDYLNVYIEAYL